MAGAATFGGTWLGRVLRMAAELVQERRRGRGRRLDPERAADHLDRLYRSAWALCGSPQLAEDLVQETYAKVLAKPRFLQRDDDLGYLLTILRNTYLSHLRTESRRVREEPLPDDPGTIPDRGEPPIDAALDARVLFDAVSALPDTYREALVAVDVAGLSYAETAAALKIPEGTVMSRLYRARKQVAAAVA